MKRLLTGIAFAVLVAAAVGLYAADRTTITVQPSQMKPGQTKVFTDDGRKIEVQRNGNTTDVRIENADKTERVTITREGDKVHIEHIGPDGRRSIVTGPDRRSIVIDGMPLERFVERSVHESMPRSHTMQNWFVCPKDRTMLRVPEGKDDQTYKCPVDGTTMEKRKGRGFAFFFDEDHFESSDL